MTQQSVLKILKRKKKWLTSKEIATYLKISSGSVAACLNKLYNQELILKKTLFPNKGLFQGAGYQPYYWRIK